MATEKQYAIFRALYDEESARYKELTDRCKTYLSIITLFGGLLVLKGNDWDAYLHGSNWTRIPFAVGGTLYIISLLLLVWAMRVREFEVPDDPEVLAKLLSVDPKPTEAAFYDRAIAGLTVATNHNKTKVDDIAKELQTCANVIAAGTIAVLGSLVGRVFS